MSENEDKKQLSTSELLILHQTYVQTITSNENRRQQLSSIYLSLIAAGVAFWGADSDIDPIFIVSPIFVISLIWFVSIRYFRLLAKAKFKTLEKIEAKFDIMPFSVEWEIFSKKKPIGLSLLDMAIPLMIFLPSLIYLAMRIFNALCNAVVS